MSYLICTLGVCFTLVSALFNYMLGASIGVNTVLGVSVMGLAYASLDIALAIFICSLGRVSGFTKGFIGLWCLYLAALSCFSVISYSLSSDEKLKPNYQRIAELESGIENDTALFNVWTDKLQKTHTHTSSWESKQRIVSKRIEESKAELNKLRASNPPLPLVVFHYFDIEAGLFYVRSAFGIGVTVTGFMLFLIVPTCSKPTPRKGSEQPKKIKKQNKRKPKKVSESNNVVQLIRNKELEPTVRGIRAKVGSTDKASSLLKTVGPRLVEEGVLKTHGRGYKYAN